MKDTLYVKANLDIITDEQLKIIVFGFVDKLKLKPIREGTNPEKGEFMFTGDLENILQLRKSLSVLRIDGQGDISPFITQGVPFDK